MQIEELLVQAERVVRAGLTVLFFYFVALWVAAVWWTFQDIRARSGNVLLHLTAILLVAGFNFPGLVVYFLLRPHRTLADLYVESLQEEALLQSFEPETECLSCGEPVANDFHFCPSCRAQIRQPCQRCQRPLMLFWKLCPYCGSSPEPTERPTAPLPEVTRA